jgi:Asp-tRNA(Asn)/Glu-tRNA(Gln) amidotransferase A subunit family amidase
MTDLIAPLPSAAARPDPADPATLTAAEAAAEMAAGRLSAEDLARATLARIARLDPAVKAFAFTDPDLTIRRAREIDKAVRRGRLHGLTLAVKDMIDTADMPTQHNSPLYIGHRPAQDAAVVAAVRAEGAVLVGKADTHEFASGGRLAASRNPHDLAHTPGGSSSGSGAAVAAGMAALALGTQTGGSVLRPASFCGVFGMKATWGSVSQEGVKAYAVSLDTLGWYGRSVADLALVAEAVRATRRPVQPRDSLRGARIGLCRTPWWDRADPAMQAATLRAAEMLAAAGAEVDDFTLPEGFERLNDVQNRVMRGEGRATFLADYLSRPHLLHKDFRDRVEDADGIGFDGLRAAQDFCAASRPRFDAAMAGWDAILIPGALGEAPRSLATTGDPMFQRAWSALHVPCVGLPCFVGPSGMPVGVQLIGPRHADAELLEVAAAASAALGAPRVAPVEPGAAR